MNFLTWEFPIEDAQPEPGMELIPFSMSSPALSRKISHKVLLLNT
jgi:hypothetical protein